MARFGLRAMWPATTVARATFKGEPARAMFSGIAAHSILRLNLPFTAAFALLLGSLGHAFGWPFVRGGSQVLSGRHGRLPAIARRRGDHRPRGAQQSGPARGAGGALRPHPAPDPWYRRRRARPRLPAQSRKVPLRPGRVQARLGPQGADPVDRGRLQPGGYRPPRRDDAGNRCRRERGLGRPAPRAPLRAPFSADPFRSQPRPPTASTPPGPTATCPPAPRST